ncbi:hypothetical protein G3G6_250 [Escherichia phage vB_EcoM-G3G6]|nr:hypothetical protein 101112UKE3-1_253 [Escherichia phage vB_EcoM-101112UKE3-1]QZI80455.1 hypothetical protein CHD2BS1_250 [Escherichia phage vB_EcoM-CHD2BS1]QZI80898.1 hypothetical protein CHD16UKE1_251 [Escherichia phage vB_EcoM-CHD16UKE1]QZI81637.1 hypothetical protein G3F6_250 [Escherichia phage vB_EcoM-G3F6]QZI82217.1 hypothetical protein G3F8_250 [Escherichia phage vB_EcoM-G3F8]QZI82507.1 hypothetical protein G3F9_250 [Escherichia phage vB_EcoM-G3F9]QZI83086.1 hypothetical protein G3G
MKTSKKLLKTAFGLLNKSNNILSPDQKVGAFWYLGLSGPL